MGKGPAPAAGLSPQVPEQVTGQATRQITGQVTQSAQAEPVQAELRLDKPQRQQLERRCIVTGESLGRSNTDSPLLRFVATPDGVLVFDAAEKLPGRGCYVSADPVLLRHALDKKAFARALKHKVAIPPDLIDTVVSQLSARVLAGFGLAKKGGSLALGEDAVAEAVSKGTATAVFSAEDASDRTANDLARRAAHRDIPYHRLPISAAALGFALGRDNTVYLALQQSQPALMRDCARLSPFGTRDTQKAGI